MESTREERLLSNSTLKYQLTGLTSTTPYRIQVAALTAAGRGTVTSSAISTGVPPGVFWRRWTQTSQPSAPDIRIRVQREKLKSRKGSNNEGRSENPTKPNLKRTEDQSLSKAADGKRWGMKDRSEQNFCCNVF